MDGMKFIPQNALARRRLAAQLVCHYGPGNVNVNTGFTTFFSVPAAACANSGAPPFTSAGRVITCPQPGDDWVPWYVRADELADIAYPGCVLDDALPEPGALRPGEVTGSTVRIDWDPVPGATAYAVEYRTPDGNWQTVTPNPVINHTTVTGLTANTNYQIRVKALGSLCLLGSGWGGILNVTTGA